MPQIRIPVIKYQQLHSNATLWYRAWWNDDIYIHEVFTWVKPWLFNIVADSCETLFAKVRN